MKQEINDGGPAFPRTEEIQSSECGNQMRFGSQGMSLRDWFAGKAIDAACDMEKCDVCPSFLGAAKRAYLLADAMLRERDGGK